MRTSCLPAPENIRQSLPTQANDELHNNFTIVDDTGDTDHPDREKAEPWLILVADDEQDVHRTTVFSLKGVEVLDRPVRLLHAYSAGQALEKLQQHTDIALVLLDVVMDSHDAGLKLAKTIRERGFNELRIILRTGQPGYAPELSVLRDYDINDYRTKSELTQQRLIGILTSALRSYRQLTLINESRRGIQYIGESSRELFKKKDIASLCAELAAQVGGLAGTRDPGVLVARSAAGASTADQPAGSVRVQVLAALGKFSAFANTSTSINQLDAAMTKTFERAQGTDTAVIVDEGLAIIATSSTGSRLYIYLDYCPAQTENLEDLLSLFSSNIVACFENIELIERLDGLAYIDPALKVPNLNALKKEYKRNPDYQSDAALVVVHLNALGHLIGVFGVALVNRLAIKVYQRLSDFFGRHKNLIATDGKSDFYILCAKNHAPDLDALKAVFSENFAVNDSSFRIECTIGMVAMAEKMHIDSALRCATSALVEAKRLPGSSALLYNHSMSGRMAKRISLQSDLRRALEDNDSIQMFLQPKVNCMTGVLEGAEALCRWFRAGEPVSPAIFIPLAEASGLAQQITDRMLECIGRFYQDRQKITPIPLKIALNQSMVELVTPDYAETLHRKVLGYDLHPELLELEITESTMMQNPEVIISELKKLRNLGYSIAIDDFGTGYSSLSQLNRLPATVLKLDKSFIDGVDSSSDVQALVSTSISLAHQLQLKVIAEGIETREQHQALQRLGCDSCQGFYFGRPVPADEFHQQVRHLLILPEL